MRRLIHFVGVGGQGVLSAARMLGEAAFREGQRVSVSQLHGMSQRGGAVQSTVCVGEDAPLAYSRGPVDVLVALELLEALRAAARIGPETTLLLNGRALPPPNLAARGERVPAASELLALLGARGATLHSLDAVALAEEAGRGGAANVVMLGALSALRCCPVSSEALEAAVRAGCAPEAWEVNRRALKRGQATFSPSGTGPLLSKK